MPYKNFHAHFPQRSKIFGLGAVRALNIFEAHFSKQYRQAAHAAAAYGYEMYNLILIICQPHIDSPLSFLRREFTFLLAPSSYYM